MSNTTVKSLCLSQPKIGQSNETPAPVLVHDISSSESGTQVTVEVPGVDPSTIEIQCENSILSISCPRGTATLSVDAATDVSKISADVHWGLMTLHIPAPQPTPAQTIKLNVLDAPKKTAKAATKQSEEFTSED